MLDYAAHKADDDINGNRKFYVRAYAVLLTLFGTGIRATECRKLTIGDLTLDHQNYFMEPSIMVTGKGHKKCIRTCKDGCTKVHNKRRTVEISSELAEQLDEFLKWKDEHGIEGMADTDYLFINRFNKHYTLNGVEKLFKKMCMEAGLRSCYSIHASRHSYSFAIYKSTKNIRLLQELLGHANISTTMIYAHVDPAEKAKAVQNIWD